MHIFLYILLSIIEIPFMIWGWISFLINLIVMPLSRGCLIFIIPSLIIWPIDIVSSMLCTCCIYLKNKVIGVNLTYNDAAAIYTSRFIKI